MTDRSERQKRLSDLRKRAEEEAASSPETLEVLSPEETRQRLHELRVHQVELEMQNEELRRAQAELDASRERYFDLYNLAPVGYCTLSEQGLILEANLTAATLLGVARGALVKRPLTRFILPETQDVYYRHRNRLLETGEPQACELRMVRGDGAAFWAHLEASTAQDVRGQPMSRVVISDITARKQAEEALRASEERHRTILQTAMDGFWMVNLQAHLLDVNAAYCRMSGYSKAELLAMRVSDLEAVKTTDGISARIQQIMEQGEDRFESWHRRKDGGDLNVEVSIQYRPTDGGRLVAFIRDIGERKHAEEDLRIAQETLEAAHLKLQFALTREKQLAHTDSLTGINNRRYLFELAGHEFDIATRYRQPLSVIMFDIDHFKAINDSFGHAVGDRILERVTEVACAEIRSADVIGRYGGEEFVIVLPMTNARQAYPLSERIRLGVAAIRVPTPRGDASVTLSIGIAEANHASDESVESIIRRADKGMYAAKHAGRNCTQICSQ